MDELDDLLSQLKVEYKDTEEPQQVTQPPAVPSKPAPSPSSVSSIDRLLAQVQGEAGEDKPQPTAPPKKISSHSGFTPKIEPSLFQELHSEYRDRDRLEAEQEQAELRQKQRLAEQRQQKKQEALREKAQAWLKQLNPKSDEGRWFEEFSYSYDSKIEAAINYLEALRESGINI